MTRINTNISSLTAQHSLRKSNDALQTALTRLSTGLRINTGKDDPAGLIASEQLGSEITSIGQSIKNSERAGNIIATADAALGEVSSLLSDVRNLVQASANKGAISAEEIAANQVQVDNALDAITRIAQTTVFGGQKLLNGTKSFTVSGSLGAFNSPTDITINSFDPTLHTAGANDDVSLTVTQQATKKSVTFKGNDYSIGAANSLLDLSVGGSTRTTSTLVSNDFNLTNATSSLASLSTGSTRYQRVITGGAGGLADLAGTGVDTVTLNVTGDLGTESITVNVAAYKANTSVLRDAINAVTDKTGVWASGTGAAGSLTLQSIFVGATGTAATLNATASTGGVATTRTIVGGANFTGMDGDIATASTQTIVAGTNFSTMTGDAGTPSTQTIVAGTSFSTMDGDASEEITFDVTGHLGTASVTVLSADLKLDSQALADAINAVKLQTGVEATTAGGQDADVTLTGTAVGTTAIVVDNFGGDAGGDIAKLQAALGAGMNTPGSAPTTITFDVTGHLGTASVSVLASELKADSQALADAINAVKLQTGVEAATVGGVNADVTLTNTATGTTAIALANFAGTSGGDIAKLQAALGAGTNTPGTVLESITFDVTGNLGTAGVTVLTSLLKANSNALVDAINLVTAQTGVEAESVGGAGANVTLKNGAPGTGTITLGNFGGTGGGDIADLQAAITAGTQTPGVTDATKFNAAVTGSAVTTGNNGALNTKTTEFTITGNKGSAVISTAALTAGGLTGNDVIINNDRTTDAGLQAFVNLINTRTDSTGVVASIDAVTHNVVLASQGVGSASLAGISVATAGADQTLINSTATKTTAAGVNGTSNTTTFELIGDLGRAVITVNNDAVINDTTVLRNAINAVTSQTGLVAAGGGFGADVTLTASKYGTGGIVTINALAASNSSDIGLLNNVNSRSVVDGGNASGTISHGKGGGSFSAIGERFSYTDAGISLEGIVDPNLTPAVRASRTIQHTTLGAGGLDSLTGTGADTISFQLTGVAGGNQVTTTISGVNVAALKADSRYLVDLINATSTTSGVRASTTGASGNIVLESTTLGAGGVVGITATAATQTADVTAFNNADTFTAITAGLSPSVGSNFDVTGGALFQIGPTVNYANQINVNITSLDLATLGRNYSVTGDKGLAALKTGGTDSLDKADLSTAASIVDQAISQVATLRGKLGAIQKNAIDSNIRSLQTSLEQVTSAQSTIRDADFAVETAALTRSQILVQAGTSVLALANQSPQNVLALLQR